MGTENTVKLNPALPVRADTKSYSFTSDSILEACGYATKFLQFGILTLLLFSLPSQLPADTTDLPDFGEAADTVISPADERRLGKSFMRWLHSTSEILDNPLLEDYLEQLGASLVSKSGHYGDPIRFFYIDNPQINAFAGPSGYIGIYTGLMLTSDSESELAAVLAHEIAHVTQRHLTRSWHAASSISPKEAIAMVAALILGAAAGGDGIAAAAIGVQAGLIQKQINFTRSNEQEADRVGITTLAEAGYESRAMASFFARMDRASRSYSESPPEFLLTHPVTNARISDASDRAEAYPYRQKPENLRYHLAKAAIKVKSYDTARGAVIGFKNTLDSGRYRNRTANQYGYALALLRDNQPQLARNQIVALNKAHPNTLEFLVVEAKIHTALGDFKTATALLNDALPIFPLSYPLLLQSSETQLAAGRADLSYRTLKQLAIFRPYDQRIFRLLAKASAEDGHPAESHEYLAQHYYLTGALKPAILQLKIALQLPDLDFYQASRLGAQLKSFEEEQESLKKSNKRSDKGKDKKR